MGLSCNEKDFSGKCKGTLALKKKKLEGVKLNKIVKVKR